MEGKLFGSPYNRRSYYAILSEDCLHSEIVSFLVEILSSYEELVDLLIC